MILGVVFDETLSFSMHIDSLCSKLSRKIGVLKKLKGIIPFQALHSLCKAIVMPHFDYCDVIWGTCGQTELDRVFRLQKRAARVITNSDYLEHSGPLFQDLKWLPLHERIDFHRCVLVYKGLHGLAPKYICNKLRYTSSVSQRCTRATSSLMLFKPRPKCELFKRSFVYSGPNSWNNLPCEIRQANSLQSFKHLVLKHKF